jgi:hypothetical protein
MRGRAWRIVWDDQGAVAVLLKKEQSLFFDLGHSLAVFDHKMRPNPTTRVEECSELSMFVEPRISPCVGSEVGSSGRPTASERGTGVQSRRAQRISIKLLRKMVEPVIVRLYVEV